MGTYRNGHDWYGDAMPDSISLLIILCRRKPWNSSLTSMPGAVAGTQSGAALEGWGNQQLRQSHDRRCRLIHPVRYLHRECHQFNDQKPDLPYKLGKYPPWTQWRASGSDPGLLEHGHTHKCPKSGRGLDTSQISVRVGKVISSSWWKFKADRP